MNVLVVGGAGYLGGALTDLLANSVHNMRVYDILLYEETYRKDLPFIYGDIRDTEKLKPHLDWADVVVWLAALVGDPACTLNEDLTRQINTDAIEYLMYNFGGRIIFTSTCSVYGAQEGLLDEESPFNPLSLYAQTKLRSEELLSRCNALIFRLGTLHGISDRFSRIRFDLVVNTLVMRAVVHKKISVFGGQQYRPLLHVRDAAAAVFDALSSDYKGICNLHSENTTIIEIARLVKGHFPDLEVEISQAMFQDTRNYRVSSEKARLLINFCPQLTVEDSVIELKNLLTQGRVKDSFMRRFSNYLYLRPLLEDYESPLGKVIKTGI